MEENREIMDQDLEKVSGGFCDMVDRTYRCRNCGRTKTVRVQSDCEAAPLPCPYCKLSSGKRYLMSYEPN